MKKLSSIVALVAIIFSSLSAAHNHIKSSGARAVVTTIEAEVVSIDMETKEVVVRGPLGNHLTLVAQEKVVKLSDISIGDRVNAEYLAALEAEVREPTEEELANPWQVVGEQVFDGEHAAGGVARQIRAVCTIEAADKDAGYVMIKDSRGKLHTIDGISAEKFEGVSLGDTVVVVYTEALALGLEKIASDEM